MRNGECVAQTNGQGGIRVSMQCADGAKGVRVCNVVNIFQYVEQGTEKKVEVISEATVTSTPPHI